ncbi:MAG: hypothetical protein P4L83_17825 [Nevskia sp.]|nr:hypothetical protein [Nevskia sp.]
MNRPRAGRAVAALLGLSIAAAAAGQQQPYTPADDAVVLEHVAPPRAPGVLQLNEVRSQWTADPHNYALALAYARVAMNIGRQEDDPRYFGYAESALQPWLQQAQPPPEVLLMHAGLRQVRKDFAGALRELDALVVAGVPESAQAQLARASLRLTQGDPAAALRDCDALTGRVDPLLGLTCRSAAEGLAGHAAASLAALDAARGQLAGVALPVQTWMLSVAAGAAERLGRKAAARADYAEAQRQVAGAGTRDPGLLAAYADFLLQNGDAAAAADLLAADVRLDSLLLRLALAERRLGEAGDVGLAARADEHVRSLGQRFAETRQRGDALHLREEAMYWLDLRHDPGHALQLAQQNWQLQREPADARVLLRAAIAAAQPRAAQPVLDWRRRTGLEDVVLDTLQQQLPAGAAQ